MKKTSLILKSCATLSCKNKITSRKFCSKCRTLKHREKDPVLYVVNTLRQNAKRRNISFSLTMEYFTEWCKQTNYIKLKGRGPDDYTIDRRKNHRGYEPGNIRILTKSENSEKYHQIDKVETVQHMKYLEQSDIIFASDHGQLQQANPF